MRYRFEIFLLSGMAMMVACLPVRAMSPACHSPQRFARLGNFRLAHHRQIRDLRLGYRLCGKLNARKSNAVLFPAWFGGNSGQMLANVGPGRLLDSRKYFVILVDPLGNGISTSPSNSRLQPGMKFPRITIAGMVRSEHRLLTRVLHLRHLHAVMGISMGGMQSFQWAVQYPRFMDEVIPIVGTPRPTVYDLLAFRAQRDMIRESKIWQNGHYRGNPVLAGLQEEGSLGLTTPQYRNEHSPRTQWPALLRRLDAPAQSPFDLNDFMRQSQAISTLNVSAPYGGRMARAAARVRARMLIVPSRQDHTVNPQPALRFARLVQARIFLLTSDCGHLASGCEAARLNPVIHAFMAQTR